MQDEFFRILRTILSKYCSRSRSTSLKPSSPDQCREGSYSLFRDWFSRLVITEAKFLNYPCYRIVYTPILSISPRRPSPLHIRDHQIGNLPTFVSFFSFSLSLSHIRHFRFILSPSFCLLFSSSILTHAYFSSDRLSLRATRSIDRR